MLELPGGGDLGLKEGGGFTALVEPGEEGGRLRGEGGGLPVLLAERGEMGGGMRLGVLGAPGPGLGGAVDWATG